VNGTFEALSTPRLRLQPVSRVLAGRILAGDLSGLSPGEGWPHAGTRNGLSMALRRGHPAGWLIVLEGTVIGDCGTHGPVDEAGMVEIGYGLAGNFQGRGLGTEMAAAVSDWLLRCPGVVTVKATALASNTASRRVLEKTGFSLVASEGPNVVYEKRNGPRGDAATRRRPGREGADGLRSREDLDQ
jgi:GNAT superfamily N-acetyltransferase